MHRKEVNERSPMRVLEHSIHGGLGRGNIGVVVARPGLGKTAFLVGIAAASVLLVIPAYIFHRKDIKDVVLVGEGMAVAAVIMAILFVIVDLGRPERLWILRPSQAKPDESLVATRYGSHYLAP